MLLVPPPLPSPKPLLQRSSLASLLLLLLWPRLALPRRLAVVQVLPLQLSMTVAMLTLVRYPWGRWTA